MPGGIAHNEFAAHLSHTVLQADAALVRVEGLLGAGDHLGGDVFLVHQTAAVGLVAAADLRQGADQPLQLLRPVPDGQIGQDVADIPELDLDVVLVP